MNECARFCSLAVGLMLSGAPGCNTAGSDWMSRPLDPEATSPPFPTESDPTPMPQASSSARRAHIIGEAPSPTDSMVSLSDDKGRTRERLPARERTGNVLGTFKNTYYEFPSESDFWGEHLNLMNAACKPIASVPRTFYESVCVQGSGTLSTGGTVSFAKRDCSCAPECPRTGQHICFDLLDKRAFPWGRGATGKGITPLLTVAVDSAIIPLGTPLYIPEFEGLPRDASGAAKHDGCFLAEDRGLAVKGDHVDVFTGHKQITQLWNRLVPSNRGVTVIVDSPLCAREKG